MRRYDCPIEKYKGSFVVLPDVWLGRHAQRRDQAVEAAHKYNSGTLTQFAVAMALLEDWSLPGLPGNVELWDFTKLDLHLIVWVTETVLGDFAEAFTIPKAYSSPSQDQ